MKYSQQLLDFILNSEDETAIMDWIESQPLLDQPDILRELKKLAEEHGVGLRIVDAEDFAQRIDAYEEGILDVKLAEAKYVMSVEAMEKASREMFKKVAGIREYVIKCIVTNAPNANEMRDLMKHVIQFEKDCDVYDPENWKRVE